MSGEPPRASVPLDALAILRAVTAHEVEAIVIGGLAVAHHGYVRATKDVDLVPDPSRENIARLWSALLELEARPLALADFRPEEMPAPFSVDGLLLGGNWDIATTHGRVDVLQYIDGALETLADYERLKANAESATFDFGVVWFVGYEDLLDLKVIAGRPQDLIDIRAIREARGDTISDG